MADHPEQLKLFDPDALPDGEHADTHADLADLAAARLSRRAHRLPTHLQQVLIMRFLDGASLQAVAKRFGTDRATARAWERQAVRRLADDRAADGEVA